jgi:hypothetical protein
MLIGTRQRGMHRVNGVESTSSEIVMGAETLCTL